MSTYIYLNTAEHLQFAAMQEGAQVLNDELVAAGRHPAIMVSKEGTLCSPASDCELISATKHSLAIALRKECVPVKQGKDKDGSAVYIEEPKLPRDLIEGWVDSKKWSTIPRMKMQMTAPVVRPDFTVRWEPGWDEDTRCWVKPGLKEDRRLVDLEFDITRVFSLFPFVDERLVADCLAAALTPLLCTAIDGALPSFLVTARKPGSGKSELAKFCSILGGGGKQFTTWRRSDEMTKLIATFAREDKRVVIFDNIKKNIDSADLESAITSRFLTFRTMATHSSEGTPSNTTWFFTANGASMSTDLLRRSVVVLLDKDSSPKPWEEEDVDGRTRGSRAVEFVENNNEALVTLMLQMIEKWRLAGCPEGSKTFSGFEEWAGIVSGILEVNGIPGFLEARETVIPSAVSTSDDDDGELVEAIGEIMGGDGAWFRATELLGRANDELYFLGDEIMESKRKLVQTWLRGVTGGRVEADSGGGVRIGRAMGSYRDRVFSGCPYKIETSRKTAGSGYKIVTNAVKGSE